MISKPAAGSLAFSICDVKLNLYLSSISLHSHTRLSASTFSTIAEKARWQMLSSLVIALFKNYSFLMEGILAQSATLAAMLDYQLGSLRILFTTSPWKHSSILMDSGDKTQFSTPRRRMGLIHVSIIEQLGTGLSLP